jgi:hypothetical protein
MEIPVKKIPAEEARAMGEDPENELFVMIHDDQGYVQCSPEDRDETLRVSFPDEEAVA